MATGAATDAWGLHLPARHRASSAPELRSAGAPAAVAADRSGHRAELLRRQAVPRGKPRSCRAVQAAGPPATETWQQEQLLRGERGAAREDAERLLGDFRQAGLDARLRMSLAIAAAQLLVRRGTDAGRAEALELESDVRRSKHVLLADPTASLELVQVCEGLPRLLGPLAELVARELEQHVLDEAGHVRQGFWYILVDLAVRRGQRGEPAAAERLWALASAVPEDLRDPRTKGRRLPWRFDSEPEGPRDCFCLRARGSLLHTGVPLPLMRPLGGARRKCPCGQRPMTVVPGLQAATLPMSGAVGEAGGAAAGAKDASFAQVCKELDRRFGLSGSLLGLGRGVPEDWGGGGGSSSCPEGSPAEDLERRLRLAQRAARRAARARSFKLRVVDVCDADVADSSSSFSVTAAACGATPQDSEVPRPRPQPLCRSFSAASEATGACEA